jgi:hypothetical protein
MINNNDKDKGRKLTQYHHHQRMAASNNKKELERPSQGTEEILFELNRTGSKRAR